MEDLLGLKSWGIEFGEWFQSWSNDVLDGLAKAVTFLGNEEAYVLLLPVLFWSVNKSLGRRLFFLAMLSTWGNVLLKNLFALPRPDPAVVVPKVEELGYGFPSNHAQTGGVVVWGYLAGKVRRRWFTTTAAAVALLIGLSRVYLGVHFIQSVVAGWVLGILVLLVVVTMEKPTIARLSRLSIRGQAALAIGVPLLVLVTIPQDPMGHYPAEVAGTMSGVLLGAGLGSLLEARTVGFRTAGTVLQRGARYLVGIVLIGALYLGGTAIPELEPWLVDVTVRVLRYAMVGLAAMWLAPWLFVRMGLATSGQD
jgi:membrane-associated phospholipid phosphatase